MNDLESRRAPACIWPLRDLHFYFVPLCPPSVVTPSVEDAEELARQMRANEALVTLTLLSQRNIPMKARSQRHDDGSGVLEMLPPGGANGRMEGDYLAVMGAEDGKNNPKWARSHGVFAGSSSWPFDYVPVAKDGEEKPPVGQKWVTVSSGGSKTRNLQATEAPKQGTTLRLGRGGLPVGDVAVGGVIVTGNTVSLTFKVVNNLSSHCKLYDTNFVWHCQVHFQGDSRAAAAARSNEIFYYSVS